MSWITSIAFYIGVVLYSVAATLYLVDLGRTGQPALRSAPLVLAAASAAHAAQILFSSISTGVWPVESVQYTLSASALIATWVYLGLRAVSRLHALGVVIAPLGLSFMLGAQFVKPGSAADQVPRSLLAYHVTANLLGFGFFLMAGVVGAFYLIQQRRLKVKRRLGTVSRLPALDSLDRIQYRLLLAGFVLLTVGVGSGAAFATQFSAESSTQLMRTGVAYITWLLVALVLVMRAVAGWRGKRGAYGALISAAGLVLVILLYIANAARGQL